MKEKKLTDEEIVKVADQCLNKSHCIGCKFYGFNGCCKILECQDYVFKTILNQKAKIERLMEESEAREGDLTIAWADMEDSRQKYIKCYREKAELQKQVDELKNKETPKKVKCHIKLPKDRIAGYCPTCDGTVDIKLTWLVKHKGHRCSWCGQAIDLTGVEVE